jgi:hypothetical protein
MVKFLWLILLRPIERFLAQWISVSTEPSAFVRERIRLGDTTNFLRAAGFFLSAVSTAFLAEVALLSLLGIGDLAEALYWLAILLTSIPFVLFCFVLVRLVAALSLREVLHPSFYPIGAGIFAGAAFALVASGHLCRHNALLRIHAYPGRCHESRKREAAYHRDWSRRRRQPRSRWSPLRCDPLSLALEARL